jgi:3-deoxy-D-manno-octulosonic-acid transferase
MLIISKHDTWPNQIWVANECKIPVFLVNASLNDKSSRIKGFAHVLFSEVYNAFDQIYAVSELDKKLFEENFKNINVNAIGDTKFDQVVLRKEQSKNLTLISESWLKEKLILIFGSVWPEDLVHLKSPITTLLKKFKNVKIIIAPHQPDEVHLNDIRTFLNKFEINHFTEQHFTMNTRILLIDSVGILADLYKHAQIAFVGGSFEQGIHNVMEPAIYGIPIIYGPKHKNSYDAIQLLKNNGSLQITNQIEAQEIFNKLIMDESYRIQLGKNALNFALSNTGVSDKLIRQWQKYLV